MPVSASPQITLQQAANYILRDSAMWEGVSLLHLPATDMTKEPVLRAYIKEFMGSNPDALLFETRDTYLVIGAKQAPIYLSGNQKDYFWTDNITSRWKEVQDALNQYIIKSPLCPSGKIENHSCSILIVEDEPLINKMMECYLSNYGTVTSTNNYHQAIANYMVQRPDMVFLDIHYHQGGMDGFDVLRNLMTADETAFIVMVSGDGQLATRLQALALGAQGFITKPFVTSQFSHYISKFTENKADF